MYQCSLFSSSTLISTEHNFLSQPDSIVTILWKSYNSAHCLKYFAFFTTLLTIIVPFHAKHCSEKKVRWTRLICWPWCYKWSTKNLDSDLGSWSLHCIMPSTCFVDTDLRSNHSNHLPVDNFPDSNNLIWCTVKNWLSLFKGFYLGSHIQGPFNFASISSKWY